MKNKSIIVALLLALVLALSAFAACDKQGAEHKSDGVYQSDDAYHWHGCTACDEHIYDKAPHEFVADGAQKKCNVCGKTIQNAEDSDEVMALYWLAARDGTKAYNGAYTVNHTEDRIEDDGQWHHVAKESWDGGERYFLQHDNSMLGEDGKYVTDYQSFFVLEPAKNGNVECARKFLQIYDNEKLTKEAKYIAPGYVCEDTAGYFPSAQLDDCGVDDGDDLASLLEGIKAYYLDEDGIEPKSVTFTRNEDGSVTLTIEMYYEGESEGGATSGEAFSCKMTATLALTAKDGKIVKLEVELNDQAFYADAIKNTTEVTKRVTEISYAFDQVEYEKIDTTTDETINAYYCDFTVIVGNFGATFFYDEASVGDTVTEQMIVENISSNIGKFVGDFDEVRAFELYTDEQLTKRFTSVQTDKEEYELYLKFVAPADKALVVTSFERENDEGEKRERLQIVYLWEADTRFYPHTSFVNYPLLTVDGVAPSGYSSFLCEGGSVHYVKYLDEYHKDPIEVTHVGIDEWTYDDNYHWHACGECPLENFDFGVHVFTSYSGGNKVCECGYTTEVTEEENYKAFVMARDGSDASENVYYYKSVEQSNNLTSGDVQTSTVQETRLGVDGTVRFVYKAEVEGVVKNEPFKQSVVKALKPVTVDGVVRTKFIEAYTSPDGNVSSRGVLKKPSYDGYGLSLYSPSRWFIEYPIHAYAQTFAEFCETMPQYYAELYYQTETQVSDISLRRNDDGTVSLLFTGSGAYKWGYYEDDETYVKNTFVTKYEIVADEYGIIGVVTNDVDITVFTDESKNIDVRTDKTITFGYGYNEELYNSVSDQTDTTTDEYVANVKFYLNGYSYNYSMENVAMGSTVTAADAKNFLADVGDGAWKPLFPSSVDPELFELYTDEAMTNAFTSLVAEEESYTLYAKLVVPQGKAVVMCLREFGSTRAIDLCYLRDVGGTFRTSILGETYPLIEVDGAAITDGSHPEITCSESRIYIVVSKVR